MEDRFRVTSRCAENHIMNSDTEGLSEFRADRSILIPIWSATAIILTPVVLATKKPTVQFLDSLNLAHLLAKI